MSAWLMIDTFSNYGVKKEEILSQIDFFLNNL